MKKFIRLIATCIALFYVFCFTGCIVNNTKNESVGYTVAFETNGGSAIEPLEFVKGSMIDIENVSSPIKCGFTFYGWFVDKGLTEQYDRYTHSSLSESDFTLYAKYENSYKISFESYGGDCEKYIYIEKNFESDFGTYFGELPTPQKDGYLFNGWYLDEEYLNHVSERDIVECDGTLYARWAKQILVTFDSNGGSVVQSILLTQGDEFSSENIDIPIKDNFVFDGWFTDADLTTRLSTITEDTLLYAKWLKALTISFTTNGGSNKQPMIVGEEQYILNLGEDPTKAGALFRGWYIDSELSQKFIKTTISESIMLFAYWIPDETVVLTSQNFADYFNITYKIKSVRIDLGNYYTYENSIVYSILLKDEEYVHSVFSSDEIKINFEFEFNKTGYESLFIVEEVVLNKNDNYSVVEKVSVRHVLYVEEGVSAQYKIKRTVGDLHKKLLKNDTQPSQQVKNFRSKT